MFQAMVIPFLRLIKAEVVPKMLATMVAGSMRRTATVLCGSGAAWDRFGGRRRPR